MAKEFTLSTRKLPLGGLPRNNMVRLTDGRDMTLAADCGRKTINQINKQKTFL